MARSQLPVLRLGPVLDSTRLPPPCTSRPLLAKPPLPANWPKPARWPSLSRLPLPPSVPPASSSWLPLPTAKEWLNSSALPPGSVVMLSNCRAPTPSVAPALVKRSVPEAQLNWPAPCTSASWTCSVPPFRSSTPVLPITSEPVAAVAPAPITSEAMRVPEVPMSSVPALIHADPGPVRVTLPTWMLLVPAPPLPSDAELLLTWPPSAMPSVACALKPIARWPATVQRALAPVTTRAARPSLPTVASPLLTKPPSDTASWLSPLADAMSRPPSMIQRALAPRTLTRPPVPPIVAKPLLTSAPSSTERVPRPWPPTSSARATVHAAPAPVTVALPRPWGCWPSVP